MVRQEGLLWLTIRMVRFFVPFADRTRYVREPDQDSPDGRLAFREADPCGPECHHPVHAFGRGKGLRHLEWFDETEALELGWRSG